MTVCPEGTKEVPCCTRDEGWPFAVGLQEQAANHLELRLLRAGVVSGEEKGGRDPSGEDQGDERERTADDVSKA